MKKILYFCTYEDTIEQVDKKLNNEASKYDFQICFSFYNKIQMFLPTVGSPSLFINGIDINEYSFVYFLGSGKRVEVSSSISRILTMLNIKFADTSIHNNTNGGKLLDMAIAKEGNIQIPDTLFLSEPLLASSYSVIEKQLGMPFVMKGVWGRKGQQVWLIKTQEEYLNIISKNPEILFIFQKFIPNNYDFRLYTFDYKALVIDKRMRKPTEEFRNNVYLGADEQYLKIEEVDKELIDMAEQISRLSSRELAGIDIIQSSSDAKYYFVELNTPPGIDENSDELRKTVNYLQEKIS